MFNTCTTLRCFAWFDLANWKYFSILKNLNQSTTKLYTQKKGWCGNTNIIILYNIIKLYKTV